MAGPREQATETSLIPLGESDRLYAPGELAGRIVNMRTTPEGTLESITGPAPWIPNRGAGYPTIGEPHGIFHAAMLGGMADLLLLRSAGSLYRYSGWNESWEQLASGLTNERRPRYPDQFVVVGDKVVWTNGIDRARLINYDGQVVPLGFEAAPATPEVDGPVNPASHDADDFLPNALGYSWWGGIGDAAHLTDAQSGWLLDGAWAYAAQLEDEFGNLGPISPLSAPVGISSMFFSPFPDDKSVTTPGVDLSGANMDDHTRSFLLRQAASGLGHAVAVRFYRTMNMKLHGNTLRFLGRHESQGRCVYPDGRPDALLGAEAEPVAAVPVFRVMTAHNGSLVIGNFPDAPGLVRESQPGFSGTFPLDRAMRPDSGGAEVTALASHNGVLHAWTETSTYAVPEFGAPSVPLSRGVGNSAPRSVQALPTGMLLWLSHDGFYGLPPGATRPEKLSGPIHRLVRDGISPGRMRLATSTVDPQTGTYICSVSPSGRTRNLLQVCFDGNGFRRYDMDISLADLTRLDDWRGYVLGCGYDGTDFNVYALHREVQSFTPPARTAMFRSKWIMADGTGSLPVRVRKLYIGMVDGSNANVTIRFYRDGAFIPVDEQTDLRAIGPDTTNDVAAPLPRNPVSDIAGSAVIGTSLIHARRLFWRYVAPSSLNDCFSWAFEVRATYPTRLVLAAFAFDQSVSGTGDPRGRILRQDDV
ncbi:MAG: hypothetical protein QME96_06875 [Myxococcota bacterium]|nr:hypothetical protein [Myxococcota bacterium]